MAPKPKVEGYQDVLESLLLLAAVPEEERDTAAIMSSSLSSIIDAAYLQKARTAVKQKEADALKKVFSVLEWAALKKMEDMGTEIKEGSKTVVLPLLKAGGMSASATVTETDTPNVEDWDALHKYMQTEDCMHLVQKRAAAKACQELWEMGVKIPGVSIYVKRSLGLRKA